MSKINLTEENLPMIEQIVGTLPLGFCIYRADENEDILYANDILLDIFGCKTLEEFKELTGYTFHGLVHPDDVATVKSSISEQIITDDKKMDHVKYRITRKDGEIRWVDDYGRFVHAKIGDVYYVFIRDITNQHFSREESRRRAKVIEGLSAGFTSIYLLNLDSGSVHPYRLQTDHFTKISEDLKSADWREIFPEYAKRHVLIEDRQLYLSEVSAERISERIKTEPSYKVNYRCINLDDSVVHMELSIIKIEDELLNHHVVMGYRDITDQITRVQKELAEKIKIEIALEKEKHANEIKASFLFSMSHDIRTPMNAIMGFTALAQRHIDEPDKLKGYLSKLNESNQHMLALIDDLLEMSKIDYGRIELKSESCNLVEQLDIVLNMFKVPADEKSINLETKFDLPNQEVYVDTLRFRRVMSNIVSNAIKFTPQNGHVSVTAYQKKVSDSGYARFEFSVKDNGVGITEDFMRRMFEAFEREETSTQTGYIGTGLGLAIAKRLLDIMGGSIRVKSKKDEGSTFTVDLPLKLANHQPKKTQELVNDYKAFDKHRILLVEDIEVNRMLAETILTESGFLVESVPDGCDAVEVIKNRPARYYDLVLMDIQMPVMNGYEATRAIRALGREDTNTLPIIALSANAREQDKQMSMESGMDSHVAKPFDIAHLISTINDHITRDKNNY